jgi:Na+/melibiose symporter-like transporter
MGEVCYKGDPMAPHNSTDFLQYETGFKMGCFGLVEYSIFMSICSGLVEKFDLFEKIGIKRIYVWSYTLLAIVCLVMFLVPTAEVILALTWILGASFAILYTIPMILLSRYHQSSHYRKQVTIFFLYLYSR